MDSLENQSLNRNVNQNRDLNKEKNANPENLMKNNQEYEINPDFARRMVMGEEDQEDINQINAEKVDNAIRNINNIMPMQFQAEGAPFNKEALLAEINTLFDSAQADRSRAALFYKVRDAVGVYKEEQDPAKKEMLLFAVKETAENYLLEKKGEAVSRKRICRDIISKINTYIQHTGLSAENRVDYLLSEQQVSDKQLDMEIQLAVHNTRRPDDPIKGNLKDRRKEYKRKIKDVRQVHILREAIAGDTYVADMLKDIAVTEEDVTDINRIHVLDAKCHRIESLLLDTLSWNMKDFEFKEPGDFVNRTGGLLNKTTYFMSLYNKLALAERLGQEMEKVSASENASPMIEGDLRKEVDARLSMLKEIKAEYDNRLSLMESPYYALTLQEDTKSYDTAEKREALVQDKAIESTGFFKKIGSRFKGFISNIGKKFLRLTGRNKTGGEFTRKTDTVKLLKWHRKHANANPNFNPQVAGLVKMQLDSAIKSEKEYLEPEEVNEELNEELNDNIINEAHEEQNNIINNEVHEERNEEKHDDPQEEIHEENPDEIRARREKELSDVKEKITKDSAKRAEELDKQTETDAKRLEKLMLADKLERYEALSRPEATMKEAMELKLEMVEDIMRLTGVKKEIIEFTPTEKIAGFISYAIENYEKEDMKKNLAEQVNSADAGYKAENKEEELVARAAELLGKGDSMTLPEKLLLYDINTLLIAMNRNSSVDDEEDGPFLHYEDFKDIDQKLLTRYARQSSDMGRNGIKEDEEYDEISGERQDKIRAISSEVLSEYTGKSEGYFHVLPIEEMASFAYEIHELLDKEKSDRIKEECIERVEELNAKISLLDKAVKGFDREKLISALSILAGEDMEKELSGMLTQELLNTANSLYLVIHDDDKLKETITNAIGLSQTEDTEECNEARFKSSYDELMEVKLNITDSNSGNLQALDTVAKEYGVRLFCKKSGIKGLSFKDFEDMDAESMNMLKVHFGTALYYKENKPADKYEEDDFSFALRRIASCKMSEKVASAIEEALNIKLTDQRKLKTVDEEQTYKIGGLMFDKYNAEKSKKLLDYKDYQEMNQARQIIWSIRSARKRDREAAKKPVNKQQRSGFTVIAMDTRDFFADILQTMSDSDLDSGYTDRIKQLILKRGQLFTLFTDKDKKWGNGYNRVIAELKNGLPEAEKKIIESFEKAAATLMKTIFDRKKSVGETALKKLMDAGTLDKGIQELADALPGIMEEMEKSVIPVMEKGISDVFGQKEQLKQHQDGPDESIPGIEVLDDDFNYIYQEIMKEDAAEKKKEEEKKQQNVKKTREQVEEERKKLIEMQNKLRFDVNKGQGKFVQVMISNYYKDSPKAIKKRMLSNIIKGMEKEDAKKNEDDLGCTYFASAIKGAGPLMQKMMQGVPERMVIPPMAEAINAVKSSLSHIPAEYVEEMFKKMKTESKGEIKEIVSHRSLGAASVAETFQLTYLDKKNQKVKVVVKILRPEAERLMKEEESFIKRSAMYADMTDAEIAAYEKKYGKTYDPANHTINVTESGFLAQYSEIKKEFDLTNEAKNCELGIKHYVKPYEIKDKDKKKSKEEEIKNARKDFRVKSVTISKTIKPRKNYIVMDMAQGETADKITMKAKKQAATTMDTFKNKNPFVQAPYCINAVNIEDFWNKRKNMMDELNNVYQTSKLIAKLSFEWIEQALFGKGDETFHHGDLHAGNIMIDLKERYSTVLDYGNCSLMTKNKIKTILNMTTAVVVDRADCFVNAFNKMLTLSAEDEKNAVDKVGYAPMSEKTKQEFTAKLQTIFRMGDSTDSGKKIILALNVAQELGIRLPKEIQNFSQCQQRLENALMDSRDTTIKLCETINELDNLPVADEDKESLDPLIRVYAYRKDKLKEGAEDSPRIFEKFASHYELNEEGAISGELNQVDSLKTAKEFVKKHFPAYDSLKKEFDVNKGIELADRLKAAFEKVSARTEIGKKAFDEDIEELNEVRNEVVMLLLRNDTVFELGGGNALSAAATNLYQRNTLNRNDLNYVYSFMKKRLPSIVKAGDAVLAFGSHSRQNGPEDRKWDELRQDAAEWVITAVEEENKMNPAMRSFTEVMRSMDKEEFERQTERMRKRSVSETKDYEKYLKAKEVYEKAKLKGDPKAISKCEEKLERAEYDFVKGTLYANKSEINGIAKDYEKNANLEYLNDTSLFRDFSTVMGECCYDSLFTLLCKLDLSLSSELKELRDIGKAKDAAEEAEKTAKEKKDKASIKEAEKLRKAYEKKLEDRKVNRAKRIEETKKALEEERLKEEEAKKKEEEKKRKEEEKKNKPKKKGWFS